MEWKIFSCCFYKKLLLHTVFKYSLHETCFAFIFQDLMNSAEEGARKKDIAVAKLEALKAVLPKQKRAELEKQQRQAENDWKQLEAGMQNTL